MAFPLSPLGGAFRGPVHLLSIRYLVRTDRVPSADGDCGGTQRNESEQTPGRLDNWSGRQGMETAGVSV